VVGFARALSRALVSFARALSRALRPALLISCLTPAVAPAQSPGLIPGVDEWAAAVTGLSTAKWVGQRVPFPLPQPPPAGTAQLDSALWPLRVHTTRPASRQELALARLVLEQAEQTLALATASNLFTFRAPIDLYLVDASDSAAFADASSRWSELDSCGSFAQLDVRTPLAQRAVCISQALLEAELLRWDPAESAVVRRASAAYFAGLMHDDACEPPPALSQPLTLDQQRLLHSVPGLSAWLSALGATRDRNRGAFVENMWQFARQRTWEGDGLRGSPDLLEAMARVFDLEHAQLEESAAELAMGAALAGLDRGSVPTGGAIRFSTLPAHLAPSAPLQALDASLRLVDLEQSRPGERLSVWARGEAGVRWALGAARLRADGSVIAQQRAAVLKIPDAELQIELSADTRYVLIAVVNMGPGVPDPDLDDARFERAVRLIVDRAR
jgi:hypothetical protein